MQKSQTEELLKHFESSGRETPAPVKSRRKPNSIYFDQIICLFVLMSMSVWKYGVRALVICFTGIAVCIITDMIGCFMTKKTYNPKDLSTITTGFIISLMMPATINYGIVAFAGFMAMVVKHIFGGKDNYIFNPAAVALAFLIICYPTQMLLFPSGAEGLEVFTDNTAEVTAGIESYLMKLGASPNLSLIDVLIGNFSGAMGTVHVLVLIVCGLCLMCRRGISPIVTFTTIAVCCIISAFFPIYADNTLQTMGYELIGGYMLFGLIFIVNDPQTQPETIFGRVLYGILFGMFAMIFRHFGKVEGSFVFAVLLANAFSIHIDRTAGKIVRRAKQFRKEFIKAGRYEQMHFNAKNDKAPKLADTQEIIIPPTNYNMPPIDNKVTKISKRKSGLEAIKEKASGIIKKNGENKEKNDTNKQ